MKILTDQILRRLRKRGRPPMILPAESGCLCCEHIYPWGQMIIFPLEDGRVGFVCPTCWSGDFDGTGALVQ